jgi:hypothetical protein
LDQVHYRAIDCGQCGSNRWVSYEFGRQAVVLEVGDTAFASSRVLLRHSAARSADDKAARASDSERHFPLTHKSGNIEMLPFIILALLAILTKSPVAIAGLLSYIGLFGYIFWPQRTSGKSLNRSRRGASVAERHFETKSGSQPESQFGGSAPD